MRKLVVEKVEKPLKNILRMVPGKAKLTWGIRGFSLYKLPLLAFCWPEVLEIQEHQSVLKIPLNYRTQNHLGVMYFGALSMGSEACVALHVLDEMQKRGLWLDFLFKDFKIQFLKRAEGDVHFVCQEGLLIRELVEKSVHSHERHTATFKGYALTPKQTGDEKIAEFEISLTLKYRKKGDSK